MRHVNIGLGMLQFYAAFLLEQIMACFLFHRHALRQHGAPAASLGRIALALTALLASAGCEHIGLSDASDEAPRCEVRKVIDGDSVALDCAGQTLEVRLYCIDAPEMSQAPWGERSRDHLWNLLPGQVRLVAHDTDTYGRVVAELISDDEVKENLNLRQVQAGQAAVYRRYCKLKEYYRAEEKARDIKSGIWESRGLHRKPWEYRRAQAR